MLSKREIIALIFLLTLITGMAYFFLFLSPKLTEIENTRSSISSLESQIVQAKIIEDQYNTLITDRDDLVAQWENYENAIPLTFDDSEVLRLLQRVIYPHTEEVNVGFQGYSAAASATVDSPVQIHSISLNFSIPYDSLDDLWQAFADETLENRIINYNLSRYENQETSDIEYNVSLTVDFLTQN